MAANIREAGEGRWLVGDGGAEMTVEREESPELGHTAGSRPHNWEALCFGNLRLRWTDRCTDSAIVYYCDIALEYQHTLELSLDGGATFPLLVECEVRNIKDPKLSTYELHVDALQPWLDAVLVPAGAPPTLAVWKAVCERLQLRSFCPGR